MWFKTVSDRTITLSDDCSKWPIVISDIAHALGNICRWGGHTKKFYSVAQHSVIVSKALPTPELQMAGLLHDAAEAYIGDMIGPLRSYFDSLEELRTPFDSLEERVLEAVGAKFKLPKRFHLQQAVQEADRRVLVTEARDLCSLSTSFWNDPPFEERIIPWPPNTAAERFTLRYLTIFSQLYPDQKPEETT